MKVKAEVWSVAFEARPIDKAIAARESIDGIVRGVAEVLGRQAARRSP